MKRFFNFLRSMKFGITLLVLVMAFSFVGSLIPQGRDSAWYIQNYPKAGTLIVSTQLDNVFYSWYFVALIGILCINLTLCSIIRFNKTRKAKKNAFSAAQNMQNGQEISDDMSEKLHAYLLKKKYRLQNTETAAVFYKNTLGYYGSFVVHLSILFTLVFGGLVLGLSKVTDYSVMPGDSQTLPDGTLLAVESFRMTDETGRTDYSSVIRITAPSGAQSALTEIKVNYPFSFGTHKYYQHSYGTAGAVTARNITTGGEDVFYLESIR